MVSPTAASPASRKTNSSMDAMLARAPLVARAQRVMTFLAVPFVVGYGLHLMRAHEPHWYRYLDERRRFEPEFDQLFAPPRRLQGSPSVSKPTPSTAAASTKADSSAATTLTQTDMDRYAALAPDVVVTYRDCYIFGLGTVTFTDPERAASSFRCVSITQNLWKMV